VEPVGHDRLGPEECKALYAERGPQSSPEYSRRRRAAVGNSRKRCRRQPGELVEVGSGNLTVDPTREPRFERSGRAVGQEATVLEGRGQ